MLNFNKAKDRRGNNREKVLFESLLAEDILLNSLNDNKELMAKWISAIEVMDEATLIYLNNAMHQLTEAGRENSAEYKRLYKLKMDIIENQPDINDPLKTLTAIQCRKPAFEQMFAAEYFKDENASFVKEYDRVRSAEEFLEEKGRVEWSHKEIEKLPTTSLKSPIFGINTTENTPEMLKKQLPEEIFHAKGYFHRNKETAIAKKMEQKDFPFIAGASGSIAIIVSFFKMKNFKQEDIEQLAIIFSAALIGAGHHSLSEVLMAAKRHNLFVGMKHPLAYTGNAYENMINDFSSELVGLGFWPQKENKDSVPKQQVLATIAKKYQPKQGDRHDTTASSSPAAFHPHFVRVKDKAKQQRKFLSAAKLKQEANIRRP